MHKTILNELIKRINILDSDYERVIRIEISHQLRYLIKELGDIFVDNKTIELVLYINQHIIYLYKINTKYNYSNLD